jgi:hypothetical protein
MRHDSPSRIDSTNDASPTDHDEQALDAIRRQLDMEYPHSVVIVPASVPAPRRRGRVVPVIGVVLACAGGGAAAAVLVTALYQSLTPPAVVLEPPPATPAAITHPLTAAAPATAAPLSPPSRTDTNTKPAGRQRATSPSVAPVPDVIWVTRPAAFSMPAAGGAPPGEDVTSEAPTPPAERAVTARARVPVVQLAGEKVRAVWDIVKERVARPGGELPQGLRSRPEAP